MAMLCFRAGDVADAIEHQMRAVITAEMTLGFDHAQTAYHHVSAASPLPPPPPPPPPLMACRT